MARRRRATSRVVKREKDKVMRQTLFFGGIAVVVVAVFVLVVIPGFIRAVDSFLDSGNPFEVQDTLPPQPPRLSIPYEATTSAKITVTGFGEAGAEVDLTVNNSSPVTAEINDEGQFETELQLDKGENTIIVLARDAAGNESATKTYTVDYDTEKPYIDLEGLEDGSEITGKDKQDFDLKGATEPRAQISINDRSIYTDSQGNFSTRYRFEEGENKLVFKSVDRAGNVAEKTITVNFRF